MCQFFSFCTTKTGRLLYFNAKQREQIRKGELKFPKSAGGQAGRTVTSPDSHSTIATFYGFIGGGQDTLNQYEYNPFLRDLNMDHIRREERTTKVEKALKKIQFQQMYPKELRWGTICNPFNKKNRIRVAKKDLENLREWKNIWGKDVSLSHEILAAMPNDEGIVRSVFSYEKFRDYWHSIAETFAGKQTNTWWRNRDKARYSFEYAIMAYLGSFFYLPDSIWKGFKVGRKTGYIAQGLVDLWKKGFIPILWKGTWYLYSSKNGKPTSRYNSKTGKTEQVKSITYPT